MQQDSFIEGSLTPEFVFQYNEVLATYREHCINQGLVPKDSHPDKFFTELVFSLSNDDECFATVSLYRGELRVELRDDIYGVERHRKIITDSDSCERPRRRR